MSEIDKVIKYTKDLKLLYVEDNRDARESTIIVLEEFFDEIIIAVDGQDGLDKFKDNEIDIIITDINMPRVNGLKMIEKIRDIDKSIYILVLSAYNESGYFIESIKLGVDGYILKPIDIDNFLTSLSKIVDKIKLKQQSDANMNLLQQYQEVTDKSSIISKTDTNGVITYVNDEFCKVTGYKRDELMGQNHNIIRHPDVEPEVFRNLWKTIKSNKSIYKGVIKGLSKNKESYYAKVTIKPILDKNGEIKEYIALRDNITDIMNPKKQLLDFIDSVDESAVVLVKIEDFRNFERFFGNKISEEIQEKFSSKLFEFMPDEIKFNKVYVLGHGEFAFAKDKKKCIGYKNENFELELRNFLNNINDAKINLERIEYDISVQISFSLGEKALENAQFGLKKLEETKQNFIMADNLANIEYKEAENNLKTLQMVRRALEDSKIVSYFQPIINNKTKRIDKYESLVRLIDEKGKVISPYFFLDLAKKGKYYSQITAIVLENSFNALKQTDSDITINLSIIDIEKKSTREKIFQLLLENKDDASRLVIELLEDENVQNFDLIKEFIFDVKKLGVKIAIDDFGTGYSNFKRLLDYQPDILKIDGSLIKNIHTDSFSLSIVKTIVAFTNDNGIETVAEFVENKEIQDIISSLGIDYSQGYYFGEPKVLNSKP